VGVVWERYEEEGGGRGGGVGGGAFSILRGIYVFSGLREPPSISRRHITRNTNSCRVFTNL